MVHCVDSVITFLSSILLQRMRRGRLCQNAITVNAGENDILAFDNKQQNLCPAVMCTPKYFNEYLSKIFRHCE